MNRFSKAIVFFIIDSFLCHYWDPFCPLVISDYFKMSPDFTGSFQISGRIFWKDMNEQVILGFLLKSVLSNYPLFFSCLYALRIFEIFNDLQGWCPKFSFPLFWFKGVVWMTGIIKKSFHYSYQSKIKKILWNINYFPVARSL